MTWIDEKKVFVYCTTYVKLKIKQGFGYITMLLNVVEIWRK